MARLNITQAAKRWNIARSTLQRAGKRGDVSIETDSSGTKYIDSSEMIRVYGEASGSSSDVAPVNLGALLDAKDQQIKILNQLVDSQALNLAEKEKVISNQRDMLTSFFKRLAPPKREK